MTPDIEVLGSHSRSRDAWRSSPATPRTGGSPDSGCADSQNLTVDIGIEPALAGVATSRRVGPPDLTIGAHVNVAVDPVRPCARDLVREAWRRSLASRPEPTPRQNSRT